MAELIEVTVVYCPRPNECTEIEVSLESCATLDEVIHRSGLLHSHPEINPVRDGIGVWGKVKSGQDLAHAGDRIEVYRALSVDPNMARIARARKKRSGDTKRKAG